MPVRAVHTAPTAETPARLIAIVADSEASIMTAHEISHYDSEAEAREAEAAGTLGELPQDVPHRALLVAAGITTKAALESVNDLTTLGGIGPAKAAEITAWLDDQ